MYTNIEISLYHLAFGLKKAGFFGGTISEREMVGTMSIAFPSLIVDTLYFKPIKKTQQQEERA